MVYSKSDILALLQRWAAAPSASFANKSLIGGRRTLHSHIAEGIGKETAEQLVAAVGRGAFARLLELNLADNAMGTAIAAELLTALQSGACPQLRTLVLHDNHIGPTAGALLAGVLAACPELEVLDVGRNRLKDEGVEAMLGAFANHAASNLKRLVFADNEESQAVVLRLCELVAEGRLPALCTVEWTAALSATLSLPFELLQALQRHAPLLVLPITTITCTRVGEG